MTVFIQQMQDKNAPMACDADQELFGIITKINLNICAKFGGGIPVFYAIMVKTTA